MLKFRGDSDAILVKGLIFVALALYSGRPAREIAETDAVPLFARMGLGGQLTRQRSNGFTAMEQRIRGDAARALADTPQGRDFVVIRGRGNRRWLLPIENEPPRGEAARKRGLSISTRGQLARLRRC